MRHCCKSLGGESLVCGGELQKAVCVCVCVCVCVIPFVTENYDSMMKLKYWCLHSLSIPDCCCD